MTALHIYAPTGYYIGQVRREGCRNWRTVTRNNNSWRNAMAGAIRKMKEGDKRARVLWRDKEGWFGPEVIMEAKL